MRTLCCCTLFAVLLLLTGCTSSDPGQPAVTPAAAPGAPAVRAVIVTSAGEIEVELYPDKAPRTVANFVGLAQQGFYAGTIFHRVANIDGGGVTHVLQGGGFDSASREKPSPLGQIPLEIHPSLTHVDGAIAMARTPDPNSASSQFYICDGPHPFLNDANSRAMGRGPGYAVFGKVVRGMEVVRAIAASRIVNRGRAFTNLPDPLVVINSVRVVE